ncbi:beta-N-acetylhexosaminidase [Echinicola shivajiensis]|uniref:beta-N-acetylhexosaminidase n=1 Tax=Echinicola shivajiensis TaxID=1035916 RepID=UPI001BFCBD42|nr:family 20 glycosylhydrolase [Echinicola shivajiensis]
MFLVKSFFSVLKNLGLLFLFFVLLSDLHAQNSDLIPKPVFLERSSGNFKLNKQWSIYIDNKELGDHAVLLREGVGISNVSIKQYNDSQTWDNGIYLSVDTRKANIHKDYYQIDITEDQISLIGASKSSLLLAVNRLVQLNLLQENRSLLPAISLKDYPRFDYRGLHIDVSRHFFPIPFLEKMIDMMAIYQLNTFHWHLTDGPGWRLEIKEYPLLTQKAAFRTHGVWKDWWDSSRQFMNEGDPQAYGGYYSQEEASALVEYARKRGITIIPEIEIPGHSEEVLAVYPELSCSGMPYTQSEFCLGNEKTFEFLEKVLTEVMEIFPSEYIHIGGDEASKKAWSTCEKCQRRIQEEGLDDEEELQSYGIRRIEKFLSKNGRKLLGWDEILEGGLAPGATVMSWRGENGGIASAKAGHEVIMTPGAYCYFDKYQTNPATQPQAIGGYLPINMVYSYNPVPEILTKEEGKLIKGVQANVWTEYMSSQEHVEYMIFPRLLALAEVAWTAPQEKEWDDFFKRLQSHYRLLQLKGINYYRPIADVTIKAVADTVKQASLVSISAERYGADVRYTLDGTDPDKDSKMYKGPFYEKGVKEIKAAIALSNGEMGPVNSKELVYHLGVGAEVKYLQEYSRKYAAQGDKTLVNGMLGNFTYSDGQWQGFEGKDLDVEIRLNEPEMVSKVKVPFMQIIGPGVFLPSELKVSWSLDGKEFSEPKLIKHDISEGNPDLIIYSFEIPVGEKIQYLRVNAKNKNRAFLFADEVVFYGE